MAAKTASVSYADELAPEALGQVLASGAAPQPFAPHLAHLLEEAPVPIVVMAVEEAASRAHVPPRPVWRNVAKLAKSLSVHRQGFWGMNVRCPGPRARHDRTVELCGFC